MMFTKKPSQIDNYFRAGTQKSKPDFDNIFKSGGRTTKGVRKANSIIFSPETKSDMQPVKYGTNEKKRRSSKKSKSRKFNQTSLVRNKDYKCIPEVATSPNLFTERALGSDYSPKRKASKTKLNDAPSDIKTIEIDVADDLSHPWFNLRVLESSFQSSKQMMRDVMKNYFVFIEFFKKIEDFSQQQNSSDINVLLEENENLFFKELKKVKALNMDTDGLQKKIQEFEMILMSISELSGVKEAKLQHEWASQTSNLPSFSLTNDTNEENQALKMKLEQYQQKVIKLEIDLKRENELRHVKYYRNDKKTNEIKKLRQDRDQIFDKCRQFEAVLQDLEAQHSHTIQENQKLCEQLQTQSAELEKNSFKNKIEYIERTQELESEVIDLRQLVSTFENSLSKKAILSGNQENTKEMLEKLSVMLLNKNVSSDFFSENQKALIRSLFGDYATTTYKQKILTLDKEIVSAKKEKISASNEIKQLSEKNL